MNATSPSPSDSKLRRTPVHAWHVANGGKMVPFAGYELPVQYRAGVLQEHLHTRKSCGLFDVSHMGVCWLRAADGRQETVAAAFERLVPADILGLKEGQQRYSQFTNDAGGIRDDLMVFRPRSRAGELGLVVNAGCKDADYAYMRERLGKGVTLEVRDDVALFALQGPEAETVLVNISRSGYTGEDGFEIAVPGEHALDVWTRLAGDARVLPIGLGARDSLRLEAGLCLYGHDLDATTSPVEANLAWSIQQRRRVEGGFFGADRVQRELRDGPARLRVALKPAGRAPVRDGAALFASESDATPVGVVTSGGYGPSLAAPVAMGYVPPALAAPGTRMYAEVRGQRLPVDVAALPVVPNRFKR